MTVQFVALDDRAYVLEEGAASPRRVLDDHRFTCVAADDAWLLCGTTDGLHRSADGRNWKQVFEGHVTSATVGPDGTCYVGTEPTRLYRSTDAGDSWTACADPTTLPSADSWAFPPRPETHHARAVAVAPDGSRLYVAVEAGALIRSSDGGESWRDRVADGPRDAHSLATHADAPGRVYAAAGDGFFVSDDGGDAWERRVSGLGGTYCWSVAVDPADPDLVYCSSATGPGSAHGRRGAESFVYRSADAGREWTRLDAAPAGEGTTRPVLVATGEGLYALSNRGLHRSTDDGGSWTAVADVGADATTASGLCVRDATGTYVG